MNYSETLHFLMTCLPMFSKQGIVAYKKDITNTIALCNAINNPQNNFKTIHVAGTNGKGSTSHMLASIMQTLGLKTGLYTSPHLKDFRERIRINGEMCDKDFVVNFVEKIKPQIETIKPSFFELTVAMSFEYFAEQKVDIAIIETGLGGRLDSTNIINPILSIITNIGLDHTDILGNTKQEIAFEKAGIIKKNIPIVIGEFNQLTKDVFINKADEEKAAIEFASENYTFIQSTINNHLQQLTIKRNDNNEIINLSTDLLGRYQIQNIITVLESIEQLNNLGWNISKEVVATALQQTIKTTGLQGRWQMIQDKPRVILDVAHNEDGIRQIIHQLNFITYKKLHCIIGMVKDKDHHAVLKLLPQNATYYFTEAKIERALSAKQLKELAYNYNINGAIYSNVNEALQMAKNLANEDDLILVFGSVFLVAEVDY